MSFFLMILIVVLHANLIELSTGTSKFVQLLFTEELTRVAVPLFFLISGYLYFINCDGSKFFFYEKMKRRIKSLIVPYLILTIIGGIFWAIVKHTAIPITVIDSVLIKPKVFYQLWFVHDLIILVLLSPLLYHIFKKMPYLWMIACYYWITGHYWGYMDCESVLFWGTGAIIALHAPAVAEQSWRDRKALLVGLLVVWICTSIVIIYMGERPFWVHGINLLLGVFVIWSCYDLIAPYLSLSTVFSFSFFLFLFHEPVLTGFKKIMLTMLELNQLTSLSVYILSSGSTIVSVILMGKCVKRYLPKLYKVINGGR